MARSRPSPGPQPGKPIRVVVVEPRAILGLGVQESLERAPGIEIVAYVNTHAEAMATVDKADPDVLLVDVESPRAEAPEATRRLHQGAPESVLVVISGDDDASIMGAVEIGATAHVASTAEPAELVATIRLVADGGDPLKDELIGRPDLVERILDGIRDSIIADRPPTQSLTPREFEVLSHVAAGMRNREIAESLGLSEETVKSHLSTILHKLGVPNRTHAVMYAVRQGWLDLEDAPDGSSVAAGRS